MKRKSIITGAAMEMKRRINVSIKIIGLKMKKIIITMVTITKREKKALKMHH